MGSRLRTFIAIDVDKPVRDRLIAMQEKLARAGVPVKWVEPDNLHLTLLFLGEVEFREAPAVCRAVAEACAQMSAFPMDVEGVGCFPNSRRPRVLWAGIGAGAEEVSALHDALEPPLMEQGCYRREERGYTPHITLGRIKSEQSADDLVIALTKQAGWHAGTTLVREVLVMSSDWKGTGPGRRGEDRGPTYTVLSRAKLLPGESED
jgi:2'-5' RNA ligase